MGEGTRRPGRGGEPSRRPRPPTRREAVRGLAREFEAAGVESARVEAERLVAHAVGVGRAELGLTADEPLTPGEAAKLARAVRRRLAGEPLQHIEGTVEFRELVLLADRRALIPRPETEQLVERVAAWARGRAGTPRKRPEEAGGAGVPGRGTVRRVTRASGREGSPGRERSALESALDVGTGSGAIALSLVAEGIVGRVVAIDVSPEALEQAARNRELAGLTKEQVEFRLTVPPAWSAVGSEERFDVIVSNPPYVAEDELAELPREVREHEPRLALAGGPTGLDVIREIAAGAADHLQAGGALFLEIGATQGDAVRRLLEASGRWRRVTVERDLAGRDRFVIAERE